MNGELRIDPAPSDEEREAVILALAEATETPPAYRSAWRESGLPGCEPPEARCPDA